ncbi:MAG: hypothetical protein IJ091_04625 [Oscillospiraceae bacterium]|nr:hypothetical protein [Oscillospiraceae bacterium]
MKKILSVLCMICFLQVLVGYPVFAKEAIETSSYENVDANPTRIVDERYTATIRNYTYGETIPESIYFEEYVNGWIHYRGTLYRRQETYYSDHISVLYTGYVYAQL